MTEESPEAKDLAPGKAAMARQKTRAIGRGFIAVVNITPPRSGVSSLISLAREMRHPLISRPVQKQIRPLLILIFPFLIAGCERTITVAGAFFPAWLICLVAALLISSLIHLVMFRKGWDLWLVPRNLVYTAMVLFLTLLIYLLFFRP